MQFHLFLPQMRLSLDRMVDVARAAEWAGFSGMVGMDHLVPPLAENQPMYEAMIANTWLAAHTARLKVGSLVLCDAMRNPVVLAREAVTLDHASGGRFELGIGWGSYQNEFDAFALEPAKPRDRVERLRETLTVLKLVEGVDDTHPGKDPIAPHPPTCRGQSRLLCDDVQRLLADARANVFGEAGGGMADLWYRMDTRHDHWLFDEFQDTSVQQW